MAPGRIGPTSEGAGDRWTWAQVCARRAERHRLIVPAQSEPAEVASVLGAIHAQVMSAAELSIGLRLHEVRKTHVQQALWDDRTLVKSYGPRGTVHLFAAGDLPMWTGALAAIPSGTSRSVAGLTDGQTDEVVGVIGDVLAGDEELTVEELGAAVLAGTGDWAGDLVVPAFAGMWPRWRLAVSTACNRGVMVFGPQRGRAVTFTSPTRWLPGFRPAAAEPSARAVLRRYLTAFGPATPANFAQWLAAPRRWAADLFESIAEELAVVELDGAPAWLLKPDRTPPATKPAGVRLLPYFDAYVVGCHPRARVYPGAAARRGLSGGQAGTMPVVLVNGEVAGVWHLRRSGRRLHFGVELFGSLTARQRAQLDVEIDRTATILEGKPAVTLGPLEAGHHL